MIESDTTRVYLAAGEYVDSDDSLVRSTATRIAADATSSRETARRIFYFVRDLEYGAPDFDRLESFKASDLLRRGRGYCVPQASAFAALCRAVGIPARLGFADVTNHLATPHTIELMGGETFAWHGYAEVLIDGRWIKVSPTFDAGLCSRMGAKPLEFDGRNDAHLQPYDGEGRAFMRYNKLHGTFHDVPARFLASEMVRLYPRAYAAIRAGEVS